MCNTGANAVVCTVCGANFPTDGKTMSQSVLEHHVSQVHVPHSTARDYRLPLRFRTVTFVRSFSQVFKCKFYACLVCFVDRFVCIICDGSAYDLLSVRKHMNERHAELMAEVKTGSTRYSIFFFRPRPCRNDTLLSGISSSIPLCLLNVGARDTATCRH